MYELGDGIADGSNSEHGADRGSGGSGKVESVRIIGEEDTDRDIPEVQASERDENDSAVSASPVVAWKAYMQRELQLSL